MNNTSINGSELAVEHMTLELLRHLATYKGEPCISIYVPARKTGARIATDTTRMRKMVRIVESKLGIELDGAQASPLLNSLNMLLSDFSFWDDSEHGLAIFLAPQLFHVIRVPIDLEESAMVSNRFDLLPLLPLVIDDGTFYLLSLSQNHIRLFRGTRQEFELIQLPKPLDSLEEFLGLVEPQRDAQLHSGVRWPSAGRSKESAVFYGTGSQANRRKGDLHEFFRAIDSKLSHMPGFTSAPLLLAGTEVPRAIYRSVSRHPAILESAVDGNIDRMTTKELHDISWLLVEPFYRRRKVAALEKYRSMMGTGYTSNEPSEIIEAAAEGRVDTCFISVPSQARNSRNASRNHDDAERSQLIGLLVSKGCRLFPVTEQDLPAAGVAAILRYASGPTERSVGIPVGAA